MTTEEVSACYPCAQGLYAECLNPKDGPDGLIVPCGFALLGNVSAQTSRSRDGVLDPSEVTDPVSTGRKRAAALAPIMSGMLCEWASLRSAGGGVIPVVGCAGNQLSDKKGGDPERAFLQGDRHHGPDKAVINNAVGMNLHRICKLCHNRWHTLNDPFYEGDRPTAAESWVPSTSYYLHDPNAVATLEEQELVEKWWQTPKEKRGEYPVIPNGLRKIDT